MTTEIIPVFTESSAIYHYGTFLLFYIADPECEAFHVQLDVCGLYLCIELTLIKSLMRKMWQVGQGSLTRQ